MATQVTEADLLDALAEATRGEGPDDARTVAELSDEAGISVKRVRAALVTLKKAGRLHAHVVVREALDGRAAKVPAYTILPAKKLRK